jgi:hypothetical protein
MASKYEPLERHLRRVNSTDDEITIAFSELKRILGCDLPDAAFDHRAWWGNQTNNATRPQARAWMNAGFTVETVRQTRESGWVTFKRQQPVQAKERLAPTAKADSRSIEHGPKEGVHKIEAQQS